YDLPAGWSIADAANRAWDALQGRWIKLTAIPEQHRTAAVTRKEWLLPLFYELGFGTLRIERTAVQIADRKLPVSCFWPDRDEIHIPIHTVAWDADLDTPTGTGPIGMRPHTVVQDYLNREPLALWGVVSNGHKLRLLRDTSSLAGSAYLEFDLETMFSGAQSFEFQLLFRMLHHSRFAVTEPAQRAVGEQDEQSNELELTSALPDGDEEDATASAGDLEAVRAVTPEDCWLEKWRVYAFNAGVQARDKLRDGVSAALVTLGNGFLNTPGPANAELQRKLYDNELRREDFHRALLRLVYRLLFLFVVEDRGALLLPHDPSDTAATIARERYRSYYSTHRLRALAEHSVGTSHSDRWHGLRLVFEGLAGRRDLTGLLGLPQLGGLFEHSEDLDIFDDCNLSNSELFSAIRQLAWFVNNGRITRVDYRNLGSDELGSVFESLLEEIPTVNKDTLRTATYNLTTAAGNQRKTSGAFYTPTALIESLLDTALEPVLDEAETRAWGVKDPDELLSVTVCDPACGSGHFLTAAARRIARRLARLRSEGEEPTPPAMRAAMHDVVARCVYGVDINPLAVELAQVALWMESIEPGRPLSFLDAQIKVGNGLLGATPVLLNRGIPQEAFKALEGDDPALTTWLKAQNKKEQVVQKGTRRRNSNGKSGFDTDYAVISLFDASEAVSASANRLAEEMREVLARPAASLEDVAVQKDRYRQIRTSPSFLKDKAVADTWCAAFLQLKQPGRPAITNEPYYRLKNDSTPLAPELASHVEELEAQYRFFHWHLEFPQIFDTDGSRVTEDGGDVTGWEGGFSCIVGNPPWEKVKLEQKEYFASRDPRIARARNKAEREALIEALPDSEAGRLIYQEYLQAKRRADGEGHLTRASGRFPLTATGDINTYPLFTETARLCIQPHGRFGLVVQTGIATDKTTSRFFSDLVRNKALVSFFDFANERFILSKAVDHRVRFCLLTAAGHEAPVDRATFAFDCWLMSDLEQRSFTMTPEQIARVNPNTGTLPIFRTLSDAAIVLGIYDRVPVLWREAGENPVTGENLPEANPWDISFMTMFHMSGDSHLFKRREELEADGWKLIGNIFSKKQDGEELRYLPLYEAKMLHHYDHRFGTYKGQTASQAAVGTLPRVTTEQHADPYYSVMPRYWVPEFDVENPNELDENGMPIRYMGVARRLEYRKWRQKWLVSWRDIARSSDTRTAISTILPAYGLGHTAPILLAGDQSAETAAFLQAVFASRVFDFVVRRKIAGTHLTYTYLRQLPVPTPEMVGNWKAVAQPPLKWFAQRVAELCCTTHDLAALAQDLNNPGIPFQWIEKRRAALSAELDGALLHLYGVTEDDAKYIVHSFRPLRRRDDAETGSSVANDLIMDVYVAIQSAIASGTTYQTFLDPPPGRGPRYGT
ncbi:MAG TPA: N-6 DNA methylase, partial [Mycobacterium sp.]|uniref:Eco57I restriction-modification methylase domain-containing protein n=1 Tax=Mycobacterium sp. TaxID=1785 RepID=UPI002D3523E8